MKGRGGGGRGCAEVPGGWFGESPGTQQGVDKERSGGVPEGARGRVWCGGGVSFFEVTRECQTRKAGIDKRTKSAGKGSQKREKEKAQKAGAFLGHKSGRRREGARGGRRKARVRTETKPTRRREHRSRGVVCGLCVGQRTGTMLGLDRALSKIST